MLDLDRELRAYAEYIDVAPVAAGEAMQTRPGRVRLHPVLVAAAAALIVLVAIGAVALLVDRTNRPVIETSTTLPAPTTTLGPTTTTTPATTTTATTTTETAALLPSITWTRVESQELTGGFVQSMSIVNGATYLTGAADGFDHGIIWRSEDGQTWERLDLPKTPDLPTISDLGNPNVLGVAYYDGTTVAVGLDCTDNESACLAAVWVSDDNGRTWERLPHQNAFGSSGLHRMLAVTTTDSGFLAVGDDVWSSGDGHTWTLLEELSGNRPQIWDVVATPEIVVGAGDRWDNGYEAALWTSRDGENWTAVDDDDGDFPTGEGIGSGLYSITQIPQDFVAVGTVGTTAGGGDAAVWLSPNGTKWRRVTSTSFKTGHSDTMMDVAAIDDLLVATGNESNVQGTHSNGVVWISTDGGDTWARQDDPDEVLGDYYDGYTDIGNIGVFNGRLIAAGNSPDGIAVWIGTIESS
jgi:hypothetical protein